MDHGVFGTIHIHKGDGIEVGLFFGIVFQARTSNREHTHKSERTRKTGGGRARSLVQQRNRLVREDIEVGAER